jgi:hypothetical protein
VYICPICASTCNIKVTLPVIVNAFCCTLLCIFQVKRKELMECHVYTQQLEMHKYHYNQHESKTNGCSYPSTMVGKKCVCACVGFTHMTFKYFHRQRYAYFTETWNMSGNELVLLDIFHNIMMYINNWTNFHCQHWANKVKIQENVNINLSFVSVLFL